MTKEKEPFFKSTVVCPVCDTTNEYLNIRSGSYIISDKGPDFCPQGITWQNPKYQGIDPLMFFMATCSGCYYTRELNNAYKKWQNDDTFRNYRLKQIKEKHKTELNKKDSIIHLLGTHIDLEKYPIESAMNKLLLGIYDEQLVSRPSILDIGRYFLRIAWLFRNHKELGGGANANADTYLARLRGSAERANEMLPDFADQVQSLKNIIEKDFTLKYKDSPQAKNHRQELEQILNEMSQAVSPLEQAGKKLIDAFKNVKKELGGVDVSAGATYYDYPSYHSFLLKVKEHWPEVPLFEKEALALANKYYEKAYRTGTQISKGIQQVQAAYLIGELSRRIGDHKNATQYFNQMLRMGRELVHSPKSDAGTVNFTRRLLEIAMDQARLNRKEQEGLKNEKAKR